MSERVGQQLGNYQLLSLLGQGGFADVYLGEHIYLKTKAAIKVLQVRITGNDMQSFLKEAQIIAALRHPRIVRILDFGLDGTTPFLIMDYAPNGTLRDLHPKGTIVPVPKIVSYVKQMAAALQYAHEQKLIHRDVKPENMLLETSNDLLLSDFGLATVVNTATAQSTKHVAGTPYYMAPEQFKGKARFASDQYALAVIVYEWLCGEPPYAEGDFIQLGFQHSYEPLPSLKEKIPSASDEIERVLTKALSKDFQQRFASVQEFAEQLEAASQKKPPIIVVPPKPEVVKPPVPRGTVHYIYRGHTYRVRTVAWSPDGKYIASGGHDSSLRVWEAFNGKLKFTSDIGDLILAVVWLPDKSFISAHYSGAICMWSSAGEKIRNYSGHSESVNTLSCSPDGKRFVSGSDDKTARVWDRASGKSILTYQDHSSPIRSVAWSSDGIRIASASDGGRPVQIWNAATGQLIFTYKGHPNYVRSVAWSPDSRRIVSCDWDKKVHVWNANDGNDVLIYRGHEQYVNTVAWSPDGRYIASGSDDTTVQVWDAFTGNLLITYRGHTECVNAVAWSPDSTLVASGCSNRSGDNKEHTVHVWQAV